MFREWINPRCFLLKFSIFKQNWAKINIDSFICNCGNAKTLAIWSWCAIIYVCSNTNVVMSSFPEAWHGSFDQIHVFPRSNFKKKHISVFSSLNSFIWDLSPKNCAPSQPSMALNVRYSCYNIITIFCEFQNYNECHNSDMTSHVKQVFRRGHKPRTINFPYHSSRI